MRVYILTVMLIYAYVQFLILKKNEELGLIAGYTILFATLLMLEGVP